MSSCGIQYSVFLMNAVHCLNALLLRLADSSCLDYFQKLTMVPFSCNTNHVKEAA